ncbi:MAG: hypothetical protein PUJ62_02215 [Lachnospiraceae bacterium]|nr:hypothetical protein [Lachnospiraceae bacterium]
MKKKKTRIKYSLLAIFALLFVGCGMLSAVSTSDREPPTITAKDPTVEYGTKLEISDLADITDDQPGDVEKSIQTKEAEGLEIDYESNTIVFGDVGEYEIELSAKDKAGNENTGTVLVKVLDLKAPELLSFPTEVQIGYNEELKLALNETGSDHSIEIQAEDKSDLKACITSIVNADGTEAASESYAIDSAQTSVLFCSPGTYLLNFGVEDEYGNQAAGAVTVQAGDTISPELTGIKPEYVLSESDGAPDYLEGVAAIDEIDGDLTGAISLDTANVLYGTVGRYTVVYQVSDNAGNICRKEVPVVIKDSTPPVLTLKTSSFSLTAGDGAPDYRSGITALDAVDGDVSGKIEIDDSGVDYNSAGSYQVSCKVSDSSGNAAVQVITVVIKAVQQETQSSNSGGSNDETVLITKTGECYHTHKCGNGTYFPVSLSEALSRGLRPCKKCY